MGRYASAGFVTGLKGVSEENRDRVEPLVLDTLSELVKSGIDLGAADAALNTIEFALRENGTWGARYWHHPALIGDMALRR